MAAERRRAAALDRRHHLQLAEAQMAGIGATPSRSAGAEDVRDLWRNAKRFCLKPFPRHEAAGSGGRLGLLELARDVIKRAHDLADGLGGNAGIKRRRVELGMAERS
jgi:hypothetical protein